ncbi:hypothetical protein [Streptomyces sp. NPDC051286]
MRRITLQVWARCCPFQVELRIAAKAAELRALGWTVSARTVERMRAR